MLLIINIIYTNKVRNIPIVVRNDTLNIYTSPDIARIAALGVPYYSFSISWSRIMPFGRGQINELALEHYDDVIKTCLEFNVQPVITLFHWDLPLYLQNLYGGFLSPQFIPDFVAYAEVIFKVRSTAGSKFRLSIFEDSLA